MAKNQSYNSRTKKWVLRDGGKIVGNQAEKFDGVPVKGNTKQPKETKEIPPNESPEKKAPKPETKESNSDNPWWIW